MTDFCQWQNYQKLIRKYKEAEQIGDTNHVKELKKEIHDLCVLCGAIPNKELMRILEDDSVHVREAMIFSERCISNGNVKSAEIIINEVNRLAGCDSGKCQCQHKKPTLLSMRGFDVIELVQEGDEVFTKFPEPKPLEPQPDIPNPLHQEIERMLRLQNPNLEEAHRKTLFPEICTEQCPNVQCPYRRPQNYGKPCQSRFDEPDERAR